MNSAAVNQYNELIASLKDNMVDVITTDCGNAAWFLGHSFSQTSSTNEKTARIVISTPVKDLELTNLSGPHLEHIEEYLKPWIKCPQELGDYSDAINVDKLKSNDEEYRNTVITKLDDTNVILSDDVVHGDRIRTELTDNCSLSFVISTLFTTYLVTNSH